ncbi:hypothetical protein [Fodinicurvata sediminis]|uniref:hypothetical protein n=1 Tax=Fodinicurvata sediminis TaxID=1121832 RepID=UPI0003B716C9|nr:hypothetical protein [Fodinicurvata sediminis]
MYILWWLILWAIGRIEPVDRDRLRHVFGWLDPRMDPHWARVWRNLKGLWRPSRLMDLPHSIENLSTEWARLDSQRSQKWYRSVIHWLLIILVAVTVT